MTPTRTVIRSVILFEVLVAASCTVVAETPSPALLVVVKQENALAIVDPTTKKIVGRVSVGENAHEVVVSSDGKLAFVSNQGSFDAGAVPGRTISVIDLASQKELRRVDVGARSRPHGLVYVGGKLYFTAEGNKLIGCYDPFSDQIEWRLGIGQNRTHFMILTKDMNRIFTSNVDSNTISAIDRAPEPTDWNIINIPVGKRPEGMAISPDGKEIWVGQLGDGGISIIDVAAKKFVQTLDVGLKHPIRLKFTLDGKRVFISDDRTDDVVVMDAAERKEIKRFAKIGKGPETFLMSPDGAYVYVTIQDDNYLAIIDLQTLEVAGRIPTGTRPGTTAWVTKR